MGDEAIRAQFSDEDWAALQEAGELDLEEDDTAPPAAETGPETGETEGAEGETPEETETEQAATEREESESATDTEAEGEQEEGAEEGGQEDKEPPVQKRIDRLTWEKNEAQRKLDLLRTNPEEYYQQYPDERPQESTQGQPQAQGGQQQAGEVPAFSQCLGMQIQGGQFEGYTLGDLWNSEDKTLQAAAFDLYNNFANERRREVEEQRASERQAKQEIEQAYDSFVAERAKEMFSKDTGALSREEQQKVAQVVQDTLDFAEREGVINLSNAWKLMNLDKTVREAEERGVKGLVEHTSKRGPRSASSSNVGSGASKGDPYAQYLEMGEDALLDKIETMGDAEIDRFLKNATPEFRQKYPALPYPD
jgi:hypothetical protein